MDQLPRPVPARPERGAKPANLLVEQRALGLGWRHVKGSHGFDEPTSGVNEQIPEWGQTYLSGIGLKVMWEKQRKQHTSPTAAE